MNQKITIKENELKNIIRESLKEAITNNINEANPFPQSSVSSMGNKIKKSFNYVKNQNNLDAKFGGFIRMLSDIEDSVKENRPDEALYQIERLRNFIQDLRWKIA